MTISKEVLNKAVRAYESKYTTSRFIPVGELKPKQLEGAIKHICPSVKPGEVVALWDETLFGNGKKGFLLTEDALYFSKDYYIEGNRSRNRVSISDFDTVKKMVKYRNCVGIVQGNGETEWIYVGINQDDMFHFFAKVIYFRSEEQRPEEEPPIRDPYPEESFGRYCLLFTAEYQQRKINAQREGRKSSCNLEGSALMDHIAERYETVNGPASGARCPVCDGKLLRQPGSKLFRCCSCNLLVKNGKGCYCDTCGSCLEYVPVNGGKCASCGRQYDLEKQIPAYSPGKKAQPRQESTRTTPAPSETASTRTTPAAPPKPVPAKSAAGISTGTTPTAPAAPAQTPVRDTQPAETPVETPPAKQLDLKRLEELEKAVQRHREAFYDSAARAAKEKERVQTAQKEGREALERRDYAKARDCFRTSGDRYLFACVAGMDPEVTVEEMMEAEYQICAQAAETNDPKAVELLEKIRLRLTSMLINREEERTVDLCGVDLPTRYLALQYALRQNDRKAISMAAYNLAIFYFKNRYDNPSMCGVEEAASLCFLAKEQDRLVDPNAYSDADTFLRECDSAMKRDYVNPPWKYEVNERIARLDRMADHQPFAAYRRAQYYCNCAKTKEDLWRAEKLAVYAVSAEYMPLSRCYYDATENRVVCVKIEEKTPEEVLREIREKLKAKGLPSKYDMTDRWKAHHAAVQKLRKAEKRNQKNSYDAAMDAYLFAGEDLAKLEKARIMAQALHRTDVKDTEQDRQSHMLLKFIETKMDYVKSKQDLEAGRHGQAYRQMDKLVGYRHLTDIWYHRTRALLCMDDLCDEVYGRDTVSAVRASSSPEFQGLKNVIQLYAEAREQHRQKSGLTGGMYQKVIQQLSRECPYPHPYYWMAKRCLEELAPTNASYFRKPRNMEKLMTAQASCQEGMAQIDLTPWLTAPARKELHECFRSQLRDIQSEIRILEAYQPPEESKKTAPASKDKRRNRR